MSLDSGFTTVSGLVSAEQMQKSKSARTNITENQIQGASNQRFQRADYGLVERSGLQVG